MTADRIERAIARIEQALTARAAMQDQMAARHSALRASVASAIGALDSVLDGEAR